MMRRLMSPWRWSVPLCFGITELMLMLQTWMSMPLGSPRSNFSRSLITRSTAASTSEWRALPIGGNTRRV